MTTAFLLRKPVFLRCHDSGSDELAMNSERNQQNPTRSEEHERPSWTREAREEAVQVPAGTVVATPSRPTPIATTALPLMVRVDPEGAMELQDIVFLGSEARC